MDFSAKHINQAFETFQDSVFGQIKTSILVIVVARINSHLKRLVYDTYYYISPTSVKMGHMY